MIADRLTENARWQRTRLVFEDRQNDALRRRPPGNYDAQRLYDLDLQLGDMDEAGVDVAVLSCLLGWSAPFEECCFINERRGCKKISAAGCRFSSGSGSRWQSGARLVATSDCGPWPARRYYAPQVNGPPWTLPNSMIFMKPSPRSVFVHPALVPAGYEHLKD